MSKSKQLGLRLTLGGAPNTPHTIPGVPGLYRPDAITPVGGPGEPTADQAEAAAKDKGTHLDLVDVTPAELEKARERHEEDLAASRGGVITARRVQPVGAEPAQISDEIRASRG